MKRLSLILTKKWIAFVIIALFAVYGSVFAWSAHDHILGMGDQATFYTFAHNLSKGEAIYQDFIHFRMPGSYAIHALGIELFGDTQASVTLMLTLESTVLYPLCLFGSILLIFWRSKWLNPLILFAATCLALFPQILQLRSGLALLAVSFYVASESWNITRTKRLLFSGMLSGFAFMFGQETALMAAVVIVASEVVRALSSKEYVEQIRVGAWFIVGVVLGALPLIIYCLVWSDIAAFLYYTLYYAFILQPKYMDLPYPEFSRTNIEYFLPFFIYFLSYLVLYMSQWKYKFLAGVVLSFSILRLITLLGRSDWGHLMFAIPEMIIIVPVVFYLIIETKYKLQNIWKFMPYGLTVAVLFVLSINYKSAVLVLVPFVLLWSLQKRSVVTGKESRFMPGIVLIIFTICSFLMAYTTKDYFIMTYNLFREETTVDDSKVARIEGMKADPATTAEINDVKQFVEPLHAKTIFSYPIQPFYYSLADHHATRFMTYEPQTTVAEQNQTIDDLKKTKPEVIVFDPIQASSLSGSLWIINNYITENYKVIGVVEQNNQLWVMVPKTNTLVEDKLALNLNHEMVNSMKLPVTIYNKKLKLKNALFVSDDTEIPYKTVNQTTMKLSVAQYERLPSEAPLDNCGTVEVEYQNTHIKRMLCAADGTVDVAVPAYSSIKIKLSGSKTKPVVWNDITITK